MNNLVQEYDVTTIDSAVMNISWICHEYFMNYVNSWIIPELFMNRGY